MKYNKTLIKYTFNIIFRDNILLILILAPILTGIAFKFILPLLDRYISMQLNTQYILKPYYPIFDIVLAYLFPCFISIISSFVILEEIDENITNYFMIAPFGKEGYLMYRLYIPSILAFIVSIILLKLFSITDMNIVLIFVISVLSTLNALIMALIVIAKANNKVEGLAWTKLVNINIIFIIVPFFIKGSYDFLFSIFPSYWISKIAINFNQEYISFNILTAIIVISVLYGYFYNKFLKRIFY